MDLQVQSPFNVCDHWRVSFVPIGLPVYATASPNKFLKVKFSSRQYIITSQHPTAGRDTEPYTAPNAVSSVYERVWMVKATG